MVWIASLITLFAGAANPFQSATNAELNKHLQQPLWVGAVVYLVGLACILLVQLFIRQPIPLGKLAGTPWWAWTGGAISIVATLAGLMLTQKLGSGAFTGLSITASLITSVMLDHFGLLGLKQHHASPGRMAGCGLLIAGVWLVARF